MKHLITDLSDVRGQWHVKRALEVTAAGGHNILLIGPDGAGCAQLARTLLSLLPTPSLLCEPSSNISEQAFEGLTRAQGVLLLKDLDTFDLSFLRYLSETAEQQTFLLAATLQPDPCGLQSDQIRDGAFVEQERTYRQCLKEVVHACFAIEIEVPLAEPEVMCRPEESSAEVRLRVESARAIQRRRYAQTMHLQVNADLRSSEDIERFCQMFAPAQDLLSAAKRQLHLTPLQMLRLQTVARTIADLDEAFIAGRHMAEAIRYLSGFIQMLDEEARP